MTRDDFDDKTKEMLRRRVNGICSNPNCNHPTQCASQSNSNKIEYIGVAAHICAASEGGPRYDENQSPEERSSIDNGIHLCSNCATMIDKNNGIDYSATTLREWKKQAEKRAREAFQMQIRNNGWVVIEFDNIETNYLAPLTGIGLNQKHIKVCPRFGNTIAEVKKYLNLNHSCCLYGKSGSGKSLTAYQIAYDYYNEGYQILKLKSDYNKDEVEIPYKDKLFLIIDNAHNYNENLIEDICNKTKQDILALFVSSSEIYSVDTTENEIPKIEQVINPIKTKSLYNIELNLTDAIKSIKNFCLKNMTQILPVVQSLDNMIGENDLDQPIERRIEIASRQQTPWLFNYILTGGWQNARKEIVNVKTSSRADSLILLIAIYQICTLDKGTTVKTIAEKIKTYNNSLDWFRQSFKILKEKELLVFDGQYVKLKHIEHSRRSLSVLEQEKNKNVINFIAKTIEECLLDLDNKKGIYSLLNAINYNCRDFFHYISPFKTDFIIQLSKKFLYDTNYDEYNIYIFEELIQYLGEQRKDILKKYKSAINRWVIDVNEHTAYALHKLLNTCINEKLYKTKEFLKLDSEYAKKLANLLSDPKISQKVYCLSEFFGRLRFFISNKFKKTYSENLQVIKYNLSNYNDLFYYSSFCKNIFLKPNFLFESFNINKDSIIKLFNNDCVEFYNYAYEIFYYVFYFGPLEIRTNSKQRTIAKSFVAKLNAEDIAKRMNKISKREIRRIGEILHFIGYFDKKKHEEIVKLLDFEYLKQFISFKDINFDVTTLNTIAYSKYGLKKVRELYLSNIENIDTFMYKSCYCIPDIIVEELQKNPKKTVNLGMSCATWDCALLALQEIFKVNKDVAEKIFLENIEKVREAIYLPQAPCLEHAVEFLEFIEQAFPKSKNKIFENINLAKIKINWQNRLNGSDLEKNTALKLIEMAKQTKLSIKQVAELLET